MEIIRTFIGIDIPAYLKDKISIVQQSLRETGQDIKWVEKQNFHITLQFLGDISKQEIPQITKGLREIGKNNSPIKVKLAGLGVFPDFYHVKVVWMGLKKGQIELTALHHEVKHQLEKLNMNVDKRQFSPHLTLGRKKNQIAGKELIQQIKSFPKDIIGEFHADELVLYQSILLPQGPKYVPLEKVTLLKK